VAVNRLRAGEFDTLIALQRKSVTYSSSGEPIETWSTLASRFASVRPLLGDERNASQQFIAKEQTEFILHWGSDINDFSPLDRVVCPGSDASSSPISARSIYDVFGVHEIGRNTGLRILAVRRVA
jgi:head-tail adaptor